MSSKQLGRVQLLIMQVLWARGSATAREITDALNESDAIAHSTVQTLLRKLEEKGSISHEVRGRTFVFLPLVEEDAYQKRATNELVTRVFGGKVSDLVAHLLKHEKVSQEELDEIRRLVRRRKN